MTVFTRPMTFPEYQELERTAQASFIQFIDIVNHDETVSFADKEAMVAAYKQCYEVFTHNCAMLQDSLDAINPAYQGMTEYRTCGERFYRKEGQWCDLPSGAMKRIDFYLHVKTQITRAISYTYLPSTKQGLIVLDNMLVWGNKLGHKVNSFNELPPLGINELLIKLGVLE